MIGNLPYQPKYWTGTAIGLAVAIILLVCPTLALAQSATTSSTGRPASDILDLDIEQLAQTPVVVPSMDIPVTSVTKEDSTVGRSAAAVFVITNEMIRRSGATCIPEALRMAPGLDVARVNSNTWAISSRGFNSQYSNKLLVLIDGRTVYSPVFSGVFWDVQDVLLEDVDRIEVIRGPGGTLWGANAVNGVINVITKKAADTQGVYVMAGGGTYERSQEAVRYGGKIGEDLHYRVYGKYFDRAPFDDLYVPDYDGWNQGRVGFRAEWEPTRDKSDTLTVQGDHYVGESGMNAWYTTTQPPFYYEYVTGPARNSGQNLLTRWKHVYDDQSDWSLQMYYDQFDRLAPEYSQKVKTFDVDFQYRFPLGERHQITCGAGYRYIDYDCPSASPFTLRLIPQNGNTFVGSQYIQDEISLWPDELNLILGCKLEQNSFTGLEYQPTARLLYTPDRKHTFWGAVSRAVRTPSIANEYVSGTFYDYWSGQFDRTLGNRELTSEALFAYELGYREQTTDRFSWDAAVFYNVYHGLIPYYGTIALPRQWETEPEPAHWVYPSLLANGPTADTYGFELATNWAVSDRWRLYAQYTLLRMLIHGDEFYALSTEGESPKHQFYFSSTWDVRDNIDFTMMVRYVDALPTYNVPSYITMDLRLAYRPREHIELAVVGQNLLDSQHLEYGYSASVPRGIYGTVTWRR